jgi:hypothetical protein
MLAGERGANERQSRILFRGDEIVRDKRVETFAAFARRIGASRQVVSRALASGRLARSVGIRRGRRCIVDVELALREWRENSSRVTHAPIRDAAVDDARPRRRARRSILVPRDQLSVSVWDDVILLARLRADGEALYLMPIALDTAVALGSRLLELAGDNRENDGEAEPTNR